MDDTEVTFRVEVVPGTVENAEGVSGMDVSREATEWKQSQNALRRSLATWEQVADALVDQKSALDQHAGVAVTDPLGTITDVNDKFCAVSQYSRDELVGKNCRIVNSRHHSKEFFAQMYSTIASGKVWQGEIRNLAKDGSIFWENTTIVPLVEADGSPRQYIAIMTDITANKLVAEVLSQSEGRLVHSAEELKRSNEDLRQLVSVASHDLQEPLRMVASNTQLLGTRYKGQLGSDADELLAFATDGCNRMQALILALQAYSRAGGSAESRCEVSTESALKESLENLRAAIKHSGAEVTHDSLPSIMTDHAQLVQVFQNLVGNAIKYRSAKTPQIHVSAAKNRSNEWMFLVRDNGIGIAPRHFERIFLFFQRLHGPEEFEGSGIGLAICKKIVERQGGRIWVESQPGEGAVFYFTLPSSAFVHPEN
jgi:two-component system, chemotaxis family, sensor kinase Cph1